MLEVERTESISFRISSVFFCFFYLRWSRSRTNKYRLRLRNIGCVCCVCLPRNASVLPRLSVLASMRISSPILAAWVSNTQPVVTSYYDSGTVLLPTTASDSCITGF